MVAGYCRLAAFLREERFTNISFWFVVLPVETVSKPKKEVNSAEVRAEPKVTKRKVRGKTRMLKRLRAEGVESRRQQKLRSLVA